MWRRHRRHRRTDGSLIDRRCRRDDRGDSERRGAGRVDGGCHRNQPVGGGRIDRQLSDGRCSIGQRAAAVQEPVGERHRADRQRRQRRARADSSTVERFDSQHRQRSPLRRKGAVVPPYRERHVSVDRRQRQRGTGASGARRCKNWRSRSWRPDQGLRSKLPAYRAYPASSASGSSPTARTPTTRLGRAST